jgi:aryl-alcohol dehydrogenase-like predicted oxidoreductase
MLTGTVTTTSGFGPQDFRRHNPRFLEPSFGLNVKAVRPLGEIARDKGVSPGQVALAWVLARGSHLIAIPGTRSPTHLAENVAAAGLRLTADDLARIERELPPGFAHGDRYSEAQAFGAERYG